MKKLLFPVLAASVLMTPHVVLADCPHSLLLGSDPEVGDEVGWSVAVEGDVAVVGAISDDDGVHNGGAAYVYERRGGVWTEVAKLTPADPTIVGHFADSVAIDGDTIVVGARWDDELGVKAGAAYVYLREGGTWSFQQKLLGSDTDFQDFFGDDVDIDGDTIVVGASRRDTGSEGAVYIFGGAGSVWTEEATFHVGGRGGQGVAISGDTVAVAAPNPFGTTGFVRVFSRSGGSWEAVQTLFEGGSGDPFGHAVDLEGDRMVVSAFEDLGDGRVRTYTREGGTWAFEAELERPADVTGHYGTSIDMTGDRIIVGATGPSEGADRAVIFDRGVDGDPESWTMVNVLRPLPLELMSHHAFGMAVAVNGDSVFVGSTIYDKATRAGAVFVFPQPLVSFECCTDLNGSGATDFADILIALAAWGTPAADLNGDGTTDFADVLVILAGWGACA